MLFGIAMILLVLGTICMESGSQTLGFWLFGLSITFSIIETFKNYLNKPE